jgi:hypothetical protein
MDEAYLPTLRPTIDVDIIVEVLTKLEYSGLEAKLRSLGFEHDMSGGAPRCRWLVDGIKVDIMSASPAASEFGSAWFEEALAQAEIYEIQSGLRIKVIGPS